MKCLQDLLGTKYLIVQIFALSCIIKCSTIDLISHDVTMDVEKLVLIKSLLKKSDWPFLL